MLDALSSDLRYAARTLRRSPAFTLVAALVVSLGVGAVTTVFSAMNAMLLRPMTGTTDGERLVRIERARRDGTGGFTSVSYPYYEHLRDRSRTLAGVAGWTKASLTLTVAEEGSAVYGQLVTGNYFALLGVRPALGRFFAPDEGAAEGTHPVIVVSEAFWRSRLGADSGAVGRTIAVNGRPFTLVGVAPAAFPGLDAPIRTDAWVPLMMHRELRLGSALTDASPSWLRLAGRLRDGASVEAAEAELMALTAARIAEGREHASTAAFDDVRLSTLRGLPQDASGALAGFLSLLLGAAALVLLIASVNVAAMLSARAIARRRELAVRAALGAGRGRLVRQLLTEVLLLFGLGAAGGAVLALLATGALERIAIPGRAGTFSIALELSPDPRVLLFALLVSLAAGAAFGLAPALRSARADLTTRLRSEAAGGGARRTLLGDALVVGQLALSLVLLVAAGLFLRALDQGRRVEPGFEPRGVAVAAFNTASWGYDEAKGRAFYAALREQLASAPGVTALSYTEYLPLVLHSSGDEIRPEGAGHGAAGIPVQLSNVDADYFAVLRLPLASGRPIERTDDARAPKVALVNETLARTLWPGGSALGRTFRFHDARVTVVGVARDAKYASLAEQTPPMVYFPLAQQWRPAQTLIVRATVRAEQLAPAIQRAVRAFDPTLPRPAVGTLAHENSIVLLPQRVAAAVTGALGAVGLLMASVGLYGLIAYSVGRRTREIGIRVALGARRAQVLGMIVRQGMRLTGAGVLLGLVAAAGAARLIARFLFGVSPLDPFTFAGTSAVLLAVALLGSYLPARRAASSDPMVALRSD